MMKYSAEALAVRPRFFRHYNNIDVYVEDVNDESFYEKLLEKILDDSVKVRKVFGMGGKRGLFEALKVYQSKHHTRLAFFIADGDFDRILGKSLPKHKNLHVLREYCIENYIIEDIAIYSVMQEELTHKSIKQLKVMFGVHNWLVDSINELTPLFACFIVIQKHNLGLKNVDNGVSPFITSGIPRLDKSKIENYIRAVKGNHPLLGNTPFEQEFKNVENAMGGNWWLKKRYICGKEYLLPLLRFEIKRHTRKYFRDEIF